MTSERNYAFRQRLDEVHAADRRDPDASPDASEVAIDGAEEPGALLAAVDIADLLLELLDLCEAGIAFWFEFERWTNTERWIAHRSSHGGGKFSSQRLVGVHRCIGR